MNKEIESVIHSVGYMYFFHGCYQSAQVLNAILFDKTVIA